MARFLNALRIAVQLIAAYFMTRNMLTRRIEVYKASARQSRSVYKSIAKDNIELLATSNTVDDKQHRISQLESENELLQAEVEFLTQWREREIQRLKTETAELISGEVQHMAGPTRGDDD